MKLCFLCILILYMSFQRMMINSVYSIAVNVGLTYQIILSINFTYCTSLGTDINDLELRMQSSLNNELHLVVKSILSQSCWERWCILRNLFVLKRKRLRQWIIKDWKFILWTYLYFSKARVFGNSTIFTSVQMCLLDSAVNLAN